MQAYLAGSLSAASRSCSVLSILAQCRPYMLELFITSICLSRETSFIELEGLPNTPLQREPFFHGLFRVLGERCRICLLDPVRCYG